MLIALLSGSGCSVELDDGGSDTGATRQENEVGDRWDLRDGHGIDRVGWPADHTGNTLLVEAATLVVELPGEVTIDVRDLGGGPAQTSVLRSTVPGIDDQLVRDVLIESPRGSVEDIGELAEELAGRYGLDGDQFGPWARRNPTFGGPDGEAGTPPLELAAGGPSLDLTTRVRSGGEAVVIVGVVWPRAASEQPTSSTAASPGG